MRSGNGLSATIAVIFAGILIAAGWNVRTAAANAGNAQTEIRAARAARAALLTAMVDEETGMRGFTSTRDSAFLAPYVAGKRRFPALGSEAVTAMQRIAEPLDDLQAEIAVHDDWERTVAAPLLGDPARPDAHALQLRGKLLVDRFRELDTRMQQRLEARSSMADHALQVAIDRILAYAALLGGILVTVSVVLTFAQMRARRRIFEQRLLYENEKHIADTLQDAFMTKELPQSEAVDIRAIYIPALEKARVGGDWYDAFQLPGGWILFSIGDVSGHGIEAAVAMSRARQAIVAAALHEGDPAMVLQRANRAIALQNAEMVTAICGFLNPASREIVYASAGHPAPVLAAAGRPPYFLAQGGLPLGIEPEADYQRFTATADPGTTFILYTDGAIEQNRDVIEGSDALLAAAAAAFDADDPAREIGDRIFGGAAPLDDVAILTFAFRYPKGEPRPVRSPFSIPRREPSDRGEPNLPTTRSQAARRNFP